MNATLRRRTLPLLSALLSAAVAAALFAKTGVFPFGKLTLLMSDMDSIYAEFLAELQRVLQGRADPFYSFHAGIGLNTLAIFVFYLSSPFNLLLALVPEAYLLDGITLMTLLKIAAAAFLMTRFLARTVPDGERDDWSLLLGICYALCGYAISYSFSLIWLDGWLLLPLAAGSVDGLVEKNRFLPLTLSLTILFFSGFYVGYMAGLFLGVRFLARLIEREPARANAGPPTAGLIFRFIAAVLLAAAINMAFILPTAYVLANNMGLFGQARPEFRVLFDLIDLPWKLFSGTFDGYKDALPFLYSGLLPLVSAALFFSSPRVPERKKAVGASVLLLLGLSFHLAPLNFAWHAFDHPSWFPFRYAFVFPFALIWLAASALNGPRPDESDRESGPLVRWAALLIGYLALIWKLEPDRVSPAFFYLNAALIAVFAVLIPLSRRFPGRRWLRVWLTVLVIVDLSLNGWATFSRYQREYTTRADYKSFHDRFAADIAEYGPKNGAFYRIEKTDVRTYNDAAALGYPGIGQFSSVSSVAQTAFLKKLGYDCYATWCSYRAANPFADSLLGIRYLLTGGAANAPYREVSPTVHENPDAFPPAFFVDAGAFAGPFADDPIQFHQQLAQAIAPGSAPIYRRIELPAGVPDNLSPDESDGTGRRWLRSDPNTEAEMRYEFQLREAGVYVVYLPNVSLNYTVAIDGEITHTDHGSYAPFLTTIVSEANEPHSIAFSIARTEDYYDDVRVYRLNQRALAGIAGSVRANAPGYRYDGRRTFTFEIKPDDSGARVLMTTIPYDAGWRATLSGEDVATGPILDGLMSVRIENKNGGTLRLSYEPPLLWLGTVISVSGLIVLFVILIIKWLLSRIAARKKRAAAGY